MKELSLTRGFVALVDDSDFEALAHFKWHAVICGRTVYAERSRIMPDGTRRPLALHRHIMGDRKGYVIDHADGNGLNNQRDNLRFCLHKENIRNRRKQINAATSRFKGVWKRGDKWRVQIEIDGSGICLGTFVSEIDAARQYDRAARVFFGRFAATNESLGLL